MLWFLENFAKKLGIIIIAQNIANPAEKYNIGFWL
jgi:hypothetical protein